MRLAHPGGYTHRSRRAHRARIDRAGHPADDDHTILAARLGTRRRAHLERFPLPPAAHSLLGPAVSFLDFSCAYLIARSGKLWLYIAAVGLAVGTVPAPHKFIIPISSVLWDSPAIGCLWVGVVIGFSIEFFLLAVLLNCRSESRRAVSTAGSSLGLMGTMSSPGRP